MIEFKFVGYVDGKEIASVSVATKSSQRASEVVEHAINHNELVNELIEDIIEQLKSVKGRLDIVIRSVLLKASLNGSRGKA